MDCDVDRDDPVQRGIWCRVLQTALASKFYDLVHPPQAVQRGIWCSVWWIPVRMLPAAVTPQQFVWQTTVWAVMPGGLWALRRSLTCVQQVCFLRIAEVFVFLSSPAQLHQSVNVPVTSQQWSVRKISVLSPPVRM